MDRSQLTNGVAADAHKWSYEAMNKYYKKYPPLYKEICELYPIDKVEGEFYKETTAMGIDDIPERDENEGIAEAAFTEGFSPMLGVRNRAVKIPITHEAKRDFTKAANFLKHSVETNLPELYVNVVNQLVSDVYNYGSLTAGSEVFNQSTKNESDSTGKFCYDDGGSNTPFMSISGISGAAHVNKSGTSYYNGLGALALNYDNLETADALLTSTNAYREDNKPFDNTQNLKIVVHPNYRVKAVKTIKSDLTPDDANTANNAFYNGYKIVVNPFFRTATSWMIGRAGFGVKLYLGKPKYNFWLDPETLNYKASVNFDYACGPVNYRFVVGVGFDQS